MKRILRVSPNRAKRTFTLRFYYENGTVVKYRTMRMSIEEFRVIEWNTENDWIDFLRTDEYYLVKK